MGLLMRKSVLLAKTETTYGVDAMATGVANAMLVKNLSITPLAQDLVQRDVIRPYLGNDEQIPATTRVECQFEVELAGSGMAGIAPAYGPLLRACAMEESIDVGVSVTYTPVSDLFKSLTMVYNLDGVNHKLRGSRGTVTFNVGARGIPVMQFNFIGLYVPVVDAVIGAVDYSAFIKPLASNDLNTVTANLLGQDVNTQSVSLNVANTVNYRNLIGLEEVTITDRASTGQISFEATKVSTYDWFAAVKSGNQGTFSVVHGTTAGNIVELASSNVQIVNPSISDSDGVAMMGLDLNFIPSTAGSDEWSIIVR